ncbi:hypothetical protein [Streptomyces microflavus]
MKPSSLPDQLGRSRTVLLDGLRYGVPAAKLFDAERLVPVTT